MGTHVMTATGGRRVLVVDDESLVRWSLDEALTAQGHDVATAGDGSAALALLGDGMRHPDVILLDYRLPVRDGLALLPALRSAAPASRIVLMTAHGSPELAGRALALGVGRVVDKPIDIDDVNDLVA